MVTLEKVKEEVADIPSFITDGDIDCYYKYANLLTGGTILDIGTGWGKSFIALALSNDSNKVYSVDPGETPIANGWAKNVDQYTDKIISLRNEKKVVNGFFSPTTTEKVISDLVDDDTVDLLHIDNWVGINNTDSTDMLTDLFKKVKKGGYILARNYGHASRPGYTASLDRATKDLTKLEQMGLIQVYQK